MSQHLDKEQLFWEAMTALRDAIETGVIDVKEDMPRFYRYLSEQITSELADDLETIKNRYAKQGSDLINEKLKANLASDRQAFYSLSKQYHDLEHDIMKLERELEALNEQQKTLKINDWVMKSLILIGFVIMGLTSLGVLVALTNLFGGVALKELWSQVYLGSFSLENPTWQGVITIVIKLLGSAMLFALGVVLVNSPWLVFTWLLAKLPYKYRKPFDISQYR